MNWFDGQMVRWSDGSIIRWLFALAMTCTLFLSACASEDIFPSVGTNLANPLSITIDSGTNRAYLVSSNNKVLYDTGSLQVLNISSPTAPVVVNSSEIASFSGKTYLDAAGGYLYLTNRFSTDNLDKEDNILRININEASADFLNIETFADGSNPFGISFDAVSSNLYVAAEESSLDYFPLGSPGAIQAISFSDLSISDGSTLTSSNFKDVAIIGRQAWLTRQSGGVLVVDLDERNADYFISDFTSPRGIVTDGVNAYIVSVETSGTTIVPMLFVINPASLTAVAGNSSATLIDKDTAGIVTASVTVGTDPQEVLLSTNYIFVSNMGADSISVINRADYSKGSDITVGDEPFGMALYSPGGVDTHIYVTNVQSNSVSIIDIATLAVTATY